MSASLVRRRLATLRLPRRALYSTKVEDDPQLGDYPRLPWKSRQELPARGWDDMLLRRNFGDPIHPHEEVLGMWGPDAPPIDPHTALKHFLVAASGFVAIGVTIKLFLVPEMPAVPREYPYDGLVREMGGLEANKARVLEAEEE